MSQQSHHSTSPIKTALLYLFYPMFGSLAYISSQFLIIIPLFYILIVATDLPKNSIKDIISAPIPYAVVNFACCLLTLVVLLLAERFYLKRRHHRLSRDYLANLFGLSSLPTWTDIALGFAGFIISFLLALVAIYLCSFLPFFDPNETQNVGFDAMISGTERVFAFLTLVVIGPIAEELLFRGWIYGRLRRIAPATPQTPSPKTQSPTPTHLSKAPLTLNLVLSIFLTSLAFAIMHGQLNVAVNVFFMSIVCCFLREFTGTIHAGIILHMLKNWLAFMILYVFHLA